MNECGEQNSHVHEASCEELREELSESLQKVRDGLNGLSATSFERLLGWMSELCAIVAKEGPSSPKAHVPLSALIQSTNEIESSFNFTIGNIIRMCFVKLFIIFFRKCCVDESEKRRLLWIWELRDDDTFNEFARLVLYIGGSRKGLIEELIFNMTRCLHDSARFITAEPESFVKTRESLEKISKLLMEMPSCSSPLTSAFGRLFSMAINVALLDNKPIASKTREICGEGFPEEVATAVPLPSVIKEETSDEMTENENEEKRMRISNKDMDLPGSSYMADLHEDDDDEDEIVEKISPSPTGSQEQKCSILCTSSNSDNSKSGSSQSRTTSNAHCQLNERLRSLSMRDIVSGDKCQRLREMIESGQSFDHNTSMRNLFKRRLGTFLLDACDCRNSPRTDEVRNFLTHICEPFPTIKQSIYAGGTKALLFEYIYNQKQRLKHIGILKTRTYRRRKPTIAPSELSQERIAALIEELNNGVDDESRTEELLEATREFRLSTIKEKGVAGAFESIKQLHDSAIIRDFEVSHTIDLAGFFTKWNVVVGAVGSLATATVDPAMLQSLEASITLAGEDRVTHLTLLRIMALLWKEDQRKRVQRIKNIYIELKDSPDSNAVVRELDDLRNSEGTKKKPLTQPIVVRYRQIQFGVFIQGKEIFCGDDGLLHALAVAVAAHYVFHLKWHLEVTDFWFVILRLIGMPTWQIKSNVAKIVADAIDEEMARPRGGQLPYTKCLLPLPRPPLPAASSAQPFVSLVAAFVFVERSRREPSASDADETILGATPSEFFTSFTTANISALDEECSPSREDSVDGSRSCFPAFPTNPAPIDIFLDAIRFRKEEVVHAMMHDHDFDVRATGYLGVSALHVAAAMGDSSLLLALIARGLDINAMTKMGLETPLHWACLSGRLRATILLVERGACLEQANAAGMTPLHAAASAGHPMIVRYLRDKGARTDVKDKFSRTPLSYSARRGIGDPCSAMLLR